MIKLYDLLTEQVGSPKAIILAGAPGAGKSSIVGDIISGIKVLNIDDYYIQNLKDAGVSLDLKRGDATSRSKAAIAMQQAKKTYDKQLATDIDKLENIVIDGTAASYNKTKQLKDNLENAGYKVLMVYVYASLKKSLKKNDDRFERSKGEDRSLAPAIVMRTWSEVTKNFFPYMELFGDNFIATTKDKKLADSQSLEDITDKYITPYKPTNTKPKTPAQKARSEKNREALKQQVIQLMKKDNIDKIIPNIVSKEEAQNKIRAFLG
jgi:adenylate kinase family enzyme